MVLHDADDVFYAAAVVCYDVVVRFFSSPIASSILAARHDRVPGADVCTIGENEFAPVELGVRAVPDQVVWLCAYVGERAVNDQSAVGWGRRGC